MISRLQNRSPELRPVILPIDCRPATRRADLDIKRETQLNWMRKRGIAWLGDPIRPAPLVAPVHGGDPDPEVSNRHERVQSSTELRATLTAVRS